MVHSATKNISDGPPSLVTYKHVLVLLIVKITTGTALTPTIITYIPRIILYYTIT